MASILALPLAQWLGLLSFVLGVIVFYQKNDRNLKVLMLVFNLNHMLHFLLMGSMVSAMSALLSAVRSATAIRTSSKAVAALFIVLCIANGVWFAQSIYDLLPIVATIIGTVSIFLLQGITMRIGFLCGSILWLANNMIIGSIGGVMLESTLALVNIMTIYRLHKSDREDQYAVSNNESSKQTETGNSKTKL